MNEIKRIRQLRSRKVREDSGTFYAEGNRIVAQAMLQGYEVQLGVYSPDLITSDLAQQTVTRFKEASIPLLKLSRREFSRLAFKNNPSGVGAVLRSRSASLDVVQPAAKLGWVALAGIGNAGNLGAIMRTCDAVGCTGVMLLDNTTDPYHPDAVRASAGSIFSLKLVRASFAEFSTWCNQHGVTIIGTSGDATQTYRDASYQKPMVLLMGSERLGLSDEQQAVCNQVVRIPMVGSADSLNLAVATSIVLYEIFNQTQSSDK